MIFVEKSKSQNLFRSMEMADDIRDARNEGEKKRSRRDILEGRDELEETREGGKDGRWRVIREWRIRGWADRGGITFLLLSIDRSSYRSALLLLLPARLSRVSNYFSRRRTHSSRSSVFHRRRRLFYLLVGDRSKGEEEGPRA